MAARNETQNSGRWFLILPAILVVACGDRAGDSTNETNGPATTATAQTDAAQKAAPLHLTSQQFDNSYRALEAAEKSIPRDTFDPRAIVDKVGSNPDDLLKWVRDNTYWIPYRGALRGPAGVLMDRLGNSLDRSLLLAELLRSAGHQVRLARGVMPGESTRELLDQMPALPRVPTNKSVSPSADFTRRDFDAYGEQFQLDADRLFQELVRTHSLYMRMKDEMSRRIAIQTPFLTKAVAAPASGGDVQSSALRALSDHWWVQRREGEQWVNLDPLLSGARSGVAPIPAAETIPYDKPSGTLPLTGEYAHEVRVRVIVEQWKGGRLTENVALDHSFLPAELAGQTIVFQNIPLHWQLGTEFLRGDDPVEEFKDRILAQTEWLPHLVIGGRSISQSGVSENGELILEPDMGSEPQAPRSAADTLAGFDAFGGGEEAPQRDGYFTAEWIEYEIRVPGQEPRRIRREVFDMLPAGSRKNQAIGDPVPNQARRLNRGLNLIGSVQILPMASRLSREFVATQTILESLANRKIVPALHAKLNGGDVEGTVDQIRQYMPTSERLYELGLARFEWSEVTNDVHLSSPNILSYRRTLLQDAQGQLVEKQGFDIVANLVGVSAKAKMSPHDTRVSQGVADTNAEAMLMGGSTVNAGSIMSGDARSDSWVTMRKPGDVASSSGDWPADVRARISEALDAGYIVVAPRLAGNSGAVEPKAWWQIDPKTGETLGIGPQGWGTATTEKVITTATVFRTAAGALVLTSVVVTWACILKKHLQGKLDQPGPQAVQELDSCACAGVDAGATTSGAVIGTWLGGPAGAVGAITAVQVLKETLCG